VVVKEERVVVVVVVVVGAALGAETAVSASIGVLLLVLAVVAISSR
jgi:hypothetical protein